MKLGIVTPLKCASAWKSIATRAEKDTWMEERKIRLHFTPPPRKMREKTCSLTMKGLSGGAFWYWLNWSVFGYTVHV